MTTGVYGIFDLDGGCLYVGQSRNIEMRWKRHISNLHSGRHRRKDFVEWFKDRGSDAAVLAFRILEECPEDSEDVLLNELEIKWFNLQNPKFYGKLPSLKDTWRHSEETKRKIADGVKRSYLEHGNSLRGAKIPSTKQCEVCQTSFNPRSVTSKFCSRACSGRSRRGKPAASTKGRLPRRVSEEELCKIMELSKTMSTREIARMYNVSHVTIHKYLTK